jgi:hypothetical protein
MVILIIDQDRVLAVEHERQAPIAVDRHRPMVFERTVQRMKIPAGSIHIFRRSGVVHREKLFPQPFGIVGLDLRLRTRAKELLDTFVPEALDHAYSV